MTMPSIGIGHVVVLTSFFTNCVVVGMSYANSAYYYGPWLDTYGAESWLTSMIGSVNMATSCLIGKLL